METGRGTLIERALFLSTLTRACVPSHLYLFPAQSRLRGSVVLYAIKRGGKEYFFRFNKADWRFDPDRFQFSTAQALIEHLDYQFRSIEEGLYSFRFDRGILITDPVPIYCKVLILKRGRYFRTAGIVVNNRTLRLKVQTAEGNVITVIQDDIELLDPEDILPFGIPICDFPSRN